MRISTGVQMDSRGHVLEYILMYSVPTGRPLPRTGRPLHRDSNSKFFSRTCFGDRYEIAHNFFYRKRIAAKSVALETRLMGLFKKLLHDRFWNLNLREKGPEIQASVGVILPSGRIFTKLQNFITNSTKILFEWFLSSQKPLWVYFTGKIFSRTYTY